ncbi:MAG: SAVED domain-containing protein [Pseudomonadota bacterium]
MAGAIRARNLGERWQALFFWSIAARLLLETPPLESVQFEEAPKGFDDVGVTYRGDGVFDHAGDRIKTEHFQCKWHVGQGELTYQDLIDPKAIGATSVSFMERLRNAVRIGAETDRFTWVTTKQVAVSDQLNDLVGNERGEILIHRLFDKNGPMSKMGRVRQAWSNAAALDEDELKSILSRLFLNTRQPNLETLAQQVNLMFQSVGLKPIDRLKASYVYDDLIWRWYEQGKRVFTPTLLRELCEGEDLFAHTKRWRTIGIRTFVHPIDDIVTRTDRLLDLTEYFDQRHIKSEDEWRYAIGPKIKSTLIEGARGVDALHLVIDGHFSVAIAAGRTLNVKCGKHLTLEQRTGERHIWDLGPKSVDAAAHACEVHVQEGEPCDNLILDLSITRDIGPAVTRDLRNRGLETAPRVTIKPVAGPTQGAVRDGLHALSIAELAINASTAVQAKRDTPITFHLFIAAPNAVAFALSQVSTVFRSLVVYEWDFEQEHGGGYRPGMRFG